METLNHFTCLSYDTIDFLIQSKYVHFGIYLQSDVSEKNILFEEELLPHICIQPFLEKYYQCKAIENCNVMLVMKKDDFDTSLQKQIVKFTGTKFPVSGNFALSVSSAVSSKIIDLSVLKLLPQGIRLKQSECGVSAIGFEGEQKDKCLQRRIILLSTDKMLKQLIRSES